ncbi:TIGR02642 family protein [Aeromonas diversa]|uniref:TIGR02642 family protein n=1 Tax=Aeromonas diversa TaxID=502790 RepID=UPI0039A0DDF2
MNRPLEIALCLYSPRGGMSAPWDASVSYGVVATNALRRDEILGALQIAAQGRQMGLHYLLADTMMDVGGLAALVEHFTTRLGAVATPYAIGILLRRPAPEQMERLINAHPHYDKERRRAAILMERAKRAHRAGNELEYRRLSGERDGVLSSARERCTTEIITTGRCPKCQGTGIRPRAGDGCPMCHGSGHAVPHRELITRILGEAVRQRIEQEVDEVLAQASEIASEVARQVREMEAA